MRAEESAGPRWDIYLFAHPDDDIFVRPLESREPEIRKAIVSLISGGRAVPSARSVKSGA